MGLSWVQILVVAVLLILLFGRGRISSLMGDIASGITSFRKGMREGSQEIDDGSSKTIDGEASSSETNDKDSTK